MRTSQLQIRVSPEQKAALRRLAAGAGLSVSAYVMAKALPSGTRALDDAIADLGKANPGAQQRLRRLLRTLAPAELASSLESVNVTGFAPLAQNEVAAVAEEASRDAGLERPRWAAAVPPLDRPHYRWPLRSLRPYQLRATPLVLKRRNIFDPAATEGALPQTLSPPAQPLPPRLEALRRLLAKLELDLEFYFVGGTILHQTFPSRTTTARPEHMFADDGTLLAAAGELAQTEGWPDSWLDDAVREARSSGVGGQGLIDLPRLKAFTPPLGYALAMKVAAGPFGGPRRRDDLRFLLRSLNLTTPDAALTLLTQYFSLRQLPADTREVLEDLLRV